MIFIVEFLVSLFATDSYQMKPFVLVHVELKKKTTRKKAKDSFVTLLHICLSFLNNSSVSFLKNPIDLAYIYTYVLTNIVTVACMLIYNRWLIY